MYSPHKKILYQHNARTVYHNITRTGSQEIIEVIMHPSSSGLDKSEDVGHSTTILCYTISWHLLTHSISITAC